MEKEKEKSSMSNRGGDDRLGGPGASSAASNNDDVQEYNLVEQSSEKVNIGNICRKPDVAAALAELVRKDNIPKLKSFLMSGKKFSDTIKEARRARKKFIRFSGILINIQTDQTKVTVSDFT